MNNSKKESSEVYLVLVWGYKKTPTFDNDNVEILGIYHQIENAFDYINHRFTNYLMESHQNLFHILFPNVPKYAYIKYCLAQNFDPYISNKIYKYCYPDYGISVGDSYEPNLSSRLLYLNPPPIKINLKPESCFEDLMIMQSWIAHDPKVKFPDYCEIPIIINHDIRGTLKRMSSETCRIKLHDIKCSRNSMYIGYNLIDIEDCEHREHHFCNSYRIYTKSIRD